MGDHQVTRTDGTVPEARTCSDLGRFLDNERFGTAAGPKERLPRSSVARALQRGVDMDTMAEHVSLSRTQIRLPDNAAAAEPSSETRPSVGQAGGGGQPRMTHPSGHVILTDQEMRDLERQNLVRALEVCGWRIQGAHGAADLLGVRPSTLRDRMRAFGIQRPA